MTGCSSHPNQTTTPQSGLLEQGVPLERRSARVLKSKVVRRRPVNLIVPSVRRRSEGTSRDCIAYCPPVGDEQAIGAAIALPIRVRSQFRSIAGRYPLRPTPHED